MLTEEEREGGIDCLLEIRKQLQETLVPRERLC